MHAHVAELPLLEVGFAAALCAAAVLAQPVASARAGALPFTSAAVDRELYRDGEVRRSAAIFATWTLVCDEIRRLRRRFCSVETTARGSSGNVIARVIVSTGDDGRPAAIMRLPLGVALRGGVEMAIESGEIRRSSAGSEPHLRPSRRLPIASCDGTGCSTVWTLSKTEISALDGGFSLRLRYGFVSSLPALAAELLAPSRLITVDGTIAARGFSQAVAASLR